MTVNLYNCTADQRRVNKRPFMQSIITLTVDAVNSLNIVFPDFTLQYNSTYPLIANYLEIPDLQRFYFITSMEQQAGTMLHIQCKVDVRMSFINGNDFPLTVIRNEYIKNSKIVDRSLPIDPQYHEPVITPWDNSLFVINEGILTRKGEPHYYEVLETQGAEYSQHPS